MKKITLTFMLTAISMGLFAQNFEVPRNYKLVAAKDYAQYEQDVVKCFDWLLKTPVNEQKAKQKEAKAFLLKWLMGSPNLKIVIQPKIVTFMGTSPNLLMIFMGGWAKYAIDSNDFNNKAAGSLAGIESVIEYYTKNKSLLPKDKNVEKYIKMKKKGKLKEYVKKNA